MSTLLAVENSPVEGLRISILHVPDCPSVSSVREEVETALERVGATAVIEEIERQCPSPTVLINGVEIDGYRLGTDPACRIELPTSDEITAAILATRTRVTCGAPQGGLR